MEKYVHFYDIVFDGDPVELVYGLTIYSNSKILKLSECRAELKKRAWYKPTTYSMKNHRLFLNE